VLSALAYVSTVENPARFVRSRSVGAHLGLTPRQYQSGEVDRSCRNSRCGDTLACTLLYEAAVVILSRVKRTSSLKDWARAITNRSGNGKARVALARGSTLGISIIASRTKTRCDPGRRSSCRPSPSSLSPSRSPIKWRASPSRSCAAGQRMARLRRNGRRHRQRPRAAKESRVTKR
jgi:hypothetical protein